MSDDTYSTFAIGGKLYALRKDWESVSCNCTIPKTSTYIESLDKFICNKCFRLIPPMRLILLEGMMYEKLIPKAH